MRRLLCIGVVVTLTACGGGGKLGDNGATLPGSASTGSGSTDTSGATTGTPGASLAVVDQGFESVTLSWGVSVTSAAEVVNTSGRVVEDMSYTARYLDANGALLYEESDSAGAALPGETMVLPSSHVFETTDSPVASVEFVVEPPMLTDGIVFGDIDLAALQLSITQTRVTPDYNEVPVTLAVVHNAGTERVTHARVVCSVRRNGLLVGGGYSYITEILPGADGGVIIWSAHGESGLPDEASCHVAPDRAMTVTAPDARGVELTTQGFSVAHRNYAGGFDVLAAAVLTNSTDEVVEGVSVQIDFYDADGALIMVGTTTGGYLLPGERAAVAPSAVPGKLDGATARIVVGVDSETTEPANAVTGIVYGETLDMTKWAFDVEGARYYVGEGTTHIVGTIINPQSLTVTDGLSVECALLSGGTTVGGAAFSVLDPLPASGTVGFDVITAFGTTPAHDEVLCTVHMNSLFKTG